MSLTDVEKTVLKKIAINRLAKEFVKRLALSASFFGLPGVSQVTIFAVSLFINYLIEWTSIGVTLVSLWASNKDEVRKAVKAKERLDLKIKNKEDTTTAEKEFDETTDSLIKFHTVRV